MAVACFLAPGPASAAAQRFPVQSAASAAAAQARSAAARRPIFAPPGRAIPPVPVSPSVRPLPVISPPVRPAYLPPIQPSRGMRIPAPLVPRPAGLSLLNRGQTLPPPIPVVPPIPQRPPVFPAFLPNPMSVGKPYCSPLSVIYNTGSICFNPNLFTIDPSFEPWGRYVAPPLIGAAGQPSFSPYSPALLLKYCPTCALKNAGLGQARGLPIPHSSAPSLTSPISVTPSGPPVILVLKSGARPLVSRYWLGRDWLIHFITVTGREEAISPGQLNLGATGTVNFERGVVFSLPGWPNP